MAIDALSRCHEEGEAAVITMVIPKWCSEVVNNYEGDEHIKGILEKLVVGSNEVEGYILKDGLLRYKGWETVGNNAELRRSILQSLHESPLGGGALGYPKYLFKGKTIISLAST